MFSNNKIKMELDEMKTDINDQQRLINYLKKITDLQEEMISCLNDKIDFLIKDKDKENDNGR